MTCRPSPSLQTKPSSPAAVAARNGERRRMPLGKVTAPRLCAAPPRRGFTLIETFVTLALVTLLAGMIVVNFHTWQRSYNLEEGALQVETLLRLTRAEAARVGLRFRLQADEETGALQVLYEPKPLEQPGTFVPYLGASWVTYTPETLVRVKRIRLSGPAAFRTMSVEQLQGGQQSEFEPITLYPDGSCDSALIELADAEEIEDDPAQAHRALLILDGVHCVINPHYITPSQYEEYRTIPFNPEDPKAVIPPPPEEEGEDLYSPPPEPPPPGKIINKPSGGGKSPSLMG